MKKDMLNEFTELDSETVEKLAENAPELDNAVQKRILEKCLNRTSGEDEVTVSGTERYVRPKYRSFAAAAAALVLIGGIGGAFAVGRKISRNIPSESETALITTGENGAVNTSAENTSVQEGDSQMKTGTEVQTVQPDTEGAAVQQPDCTEPASYQEYKVPENVDDEQYEAWMKEVPEEYWDVVRNLKPGDVIHLPCFPVKEIPTDSGETTTCSPQTTTLPPETTAPPQTTEPDTEPDTGKTPDMYNPMTNQAVIQPIDGYWISDWCGSSYWWFDSQNRTGTYYNSNTCSGFHFNYNYYTSDSHIELMVLDRGNGYSGTLYGTGNVVWISDDNFYISWKEGSPIRQGGDSFERFVRNKAESMPEGEDINKPQPE